jgi:hypothetical protein
VPLCSDEQSRHPADDELHDDEEGGAHGGGGEQLHTRIIGIGVRGGRGLPSPGRIRWDQGGFVCGNFR